MNTHTQITNLENKSTENRKTWKHVSVSMCSVHFLMDFKLMDSILFGDDLNTEKWRLRRAFFKIHRKCFVEEPAAFLPAKKQSKITLERSVKN